MVVLHVLLLVGCLVEVWVWHRPRDAPVLAAVMLVLVLASQALRWWCITTLGPRWNTRIVVVPGLPRVTAGPYRCLSHPNYVAVVIEGLALPMVGSRGSRPSSSPSSTPRSWRCGSAPGGALPSRRWRLSGDRPPRRRRRARRSRDGRARAARRARRGRGRAARRPDDKACGEGLMPDARPPAAAARRRSCRAALAGIRYLDDAPRGRGAVHRRPRARGATYDLQAPHWRNERATSGSGSSRATPGRRGPGQAPSDRVRRDRPVRSSLPTGCTPRSRRQLGLHRAARGARRVRRAAAPPRRAVDRPRRGALDERRRGLRDACRRATSSASQCSAPRPLSFRAALAAAPRARRTARAGVAGGPAPGGRSASPADLGTDQRPGAARRRRRGLCRRAHW